MTLFFNIKKKTLLSFLGFHDNSLLICLLIPHLFTVSWIPRHLLTDPGVSPQHRVQPHVTIPHLATSACIRQQEPLFSASPHLHPPNLDCSSSCWCLTPCTRLIFSMMNTNNETAPTFTERLLHTRRCSEPFTYVISFSPQNRLMRQVLYQPHLINGETKTEVESATTARRTTGGTGV